MSDDFSNHPASISELRAKKDRSGAMWTPRDALIDGLRDIDNGLKVDAVVICFRQHDDGATVTFAQASPDPATAVGVWQIAGHRLMKGDM